MSREISVDDVMDAYHSPAFIDILKRLDTAQAVQIENEVGDASQISTHVTLNLAYITNVTVAGLIAVLGLGTTDDVRRWGEARTRQGEAFNSLLRDLKIDV